MKKYNPEQFKEAFIKRVSEKFNMQCPYCGHRQFTTTDKTAYLFIGDDLHTANLGPNIPAGMIICENCGHIELFALGALGLLEKEKGEYDAK